MNKGLIVVIIGCLIFWALAGTGIAMVYKKVSDTKVKVTETTEISEELTLGQVEYEIACIDRDIARLNASIDELKARRDRYTTIKAEAKDLGVVEPISIGE